MRRTRILTIDHFMKIFRVSEISWFHVVHFARPLVAPPKVMILIDSVVCFYDVEFNVFMAYGIPYQCSIFIATGHDLDPQRRVSRSLLHVADFITQGGTKWETSRRGLAPCSVR